MVKWFYHHIRNYGRTPQHENRQMPVVIIADINS